MQGPPPPLLPRHDRYDYMPLPQRPVFDWPGQRRPGDIAAHCAALPEKAMPGR